MLTLPAYQLATKRPTSLCSWSRLSRSSSEASSAWHQRRTMMNFVFLMYFSCMICYFTPALNATKWAY